VPAFTGWHDAGVVDAPVSSTGIDDHREDSNVMHPVQSQDFIHTLAIEARLRDKAMERKRLAHGAAPIRPSTTARMRQFAVSIGHAIHRFADPRGYAIAHMNEAQPPTPPVGARETRRLDIMPQPDIFDGDERIAS
jgi:hypothetical protein